MTTKDMMALWTALGVAVTLAGRAHAEGSCAAHEQVVARLGQAYGETMRSVGLSANGLIVETFASEAGTWTIILTDPSGRSCLAAAGDAWQDVPPRKPGEGA